MTVKMYTHYVMLYWAPIRLDILNKHLQLWMYLLSVSFLCFIL